MNALNIQDEVTQLYFELLRQKVKDQYRGHQDYHLILGSINSKVPVVGGKVKVQKEDKNGNYYTVTYNVAVKDDLGNFIQSIDDLGGQCVKGEIAKKGYIFTCMECGQTFCRKHIKFVDHNSNKPLCRYGFMGWEGCYSAHKHRYSTGITRTHKDTLRDQLEAERMITEIAKVRQERENIINSQSIVASSRGGNQLPSQSRQPSLMTRLIHGSVQSVQCGNPVCNATITLSGITCPSCRNVIDIGINDPVKCPICSAPIRTVDCPSCQAKIEL